MSPTFFTTDDGDLVLRAGPESESKHDFRVHKFILSLASPVFKDMFAFPQPPNQTLNEGHQLSTVDVPEPPKVIDTILRLIYPGVEPPKIADIPTLTALLSVADKYNITSIYPTLKNTLKTFLPHNPFRAYVVACRFGFLAEAKEAARVGNTRSIVFEGLCDEVRHIPSTDLLRWDRLVQEREINGRRRIEELLDLGGLREDADCDHGKDGKTFYFCLEKAVCDAFALNPAIGKGELFTVLDEIPDPPPGCEPPPESAVFYRDGGHDNAFLCPLQPMSIRNQLVEVAEGLEDLNRAMIYRAFEEGAGSS